MIKILLFINWFFIELMHPVHISLVNIDYNENDKEFIVLFKLYTDDFNQIIYHYYGIDIVALKEANEKLDIKMINSYITQNFRIENNKKELKLEFIELNFDNDSIWIKYRIKVRNDIKQLFIQSDLLNDLYYDQNNLIILRYKSFEKGYQLNYNENIVEINLENY